MEIDSVDKIVRSYFTAVAAETFEYKGETYYPQTLRVSQLIFRGYTCPPGCGGCCKRFSLDYLPSETRPFNTMPRVVEFDRRFITIYSDMQNDHRNRDCRNLRKEDGRCTIHGHHPFSCDFELIRAFHPSNPVVRALAQRPARLSAQLYGRGWQFLRVDDKRGALCEMLPVSDESRLDVIRKLKRLKEWTDHFGLRKTYIPDIMKWAEGNGPVPITRPLFVGRINELAGSTDHL